MKKWISGIASAVMLLGASLSAQAVIIAPPPPPPVAVDLELVLAVDVSGSVDTGEFNLQRTGYANAFQLASVQNAIDSGAIGAIAAQLVYWSSGQAIGVDWELIDDGTNGLTAAQFGALIGAAGRPFSGLTGIGNAISFSHNELDTNNFLGTRRVIDVSGDGANNSGVAPNGPRNTAAAAGITINGLPIGSASLATYYANNVVTADGFTLPVSNFADFSDAVARKIEAEIRNENPVPAPLSLSLLVMGLAALKYRARKA